MNKSLVVLDSSIAIFNLIETDQSEIAVDQLSCLTKQQVKLCAPRLWLYEVISGIRKYRYANLITTKQAETAVELAISFGIEFIEETLTLCHSALRWADRLGQMAAYGSVYIAAAESLDCPFWTGDEKLVNNARAAGAGFVYWIGEGIEVAE